VDFFGTLGGIQKVLSTGFVTLNWEKITKTTEVEWIGGCGMSYPMSLIKEIGKFNEKFIGNAYYEDVDYSYRVFKHGYKLYNLANTGIHHFVAPLNRESFARLKYYQLVNQKIFFKSNVFSGSTIQLIRFYIAHIALILPFLIYSITTRNFDIMRTYFSAELGIKY